MCNLYSITTNQAAIIALFRVINRYVGNLAPMPGVFPDFPAPVIRNSEGGPEMLMMRWGMPPPPRMGGAPVTNIRNTSSPHWRTWLRPENRCLVPFNSFAEYAPEQNPDTKQKDVVWFALNDDRPLAAFAGIWTTFNGDRGTKIETDPRTTQRLRLPDDFAERRGRADPSEGDAGDHDDGRGARCLDAGAMG
jgi:putative SOS response-associated peptidase YedK